MTKHAFLTASFQCLAKSLPSDLSLGRLYWVCIFALKNVFQPCSQGILPLFPYG